MLLSILAVKATRWISCSKKIKGPLPGSKRKEFLRKWLGIIKCLSTSQLQEVKPATFTSERFNLSSVHVLETA